MGKKYKNKPNKSQFFSIDCHTENDIEIQEMPNNAAIDESNA